MSSDTRVDHELPEDSVARALDQALAASTRWLEPAIRIDTAPKCNGIDPGSELALPARLATGYFLDFPADARTRVELASMPFYGDRPTITPRDHDQTTADAWAGLAERTPLHGLKARLHDLLAQRGSRMFPMHAYREIDAYCDLVEDPHVSVSVDGEDELPSWS